MNPRLGVRLMAIGRTALGAAVLAAPEQVTARWLGRDNAELPVVVDLARGLAIRDIALGVAALQTLGDDLSGPRIQAATAAADLVDAVAIVLARKALPRIGVIGTAVVAGAAAAAGFLFSHQIAHSGER